MRTCTLLVTIAVTLFASDSVIAQRGGGAAGGGRNRWRRPDEVTTRTAAFFSEVQAPATDGDKVADLNTIDLVRAAAASGQVTLLYLHDGQADKTVVQQFEAALFRADKSGDQLGIKMRMFHCGQIDTSKSPALQERYGKVVPVFVAFDKNGKELKPVSMSGYQAKASALEALLDQASSGAFKPALKTLAKKYADIVGDLEEALKAKSEAQQAQTKAGNDKAKGKEAEQELVAATKLEQKALEQESKLLEGLRLPARGSKRLGGRGNGRANGAGGNPGG